MMGMNRIRALEAARDVLIEIKSNYGQGLSVAGWHLNGELVPMDIWIDDWGVNEALKNVLEALGENNVKRS